MKNYIFIIVILFCLLVITGCKSEINQSDNIEQINIETAIHWGMSKNDLGKIVTLRQSKYDDGDDEDIYSFRFGEPYSIFDISDTEALYTFCQDKLVAVSYTFSKLSYNDDSLNNIFQQLSSKLSEKYGESTQEENEKETMVWNTELTKISLCKGKYEVSLRFNSIEDYFDESQVKDQIDYPVLYSEYFINTANALKISTEHDSITWDIIKKNYTWDSVYEKLIKENMKFDYKKPSKTIDGTITIYGDDNENIIYSFHNSFGSDNYYCYSVEYNKNGNSIRATTFNKSYGATFKYVTHINDEYTDNLSEKEAEKKFFSAS